MIKIVHIADLHFGLEHGRFPAISDKLKEERFRALKLVIQRANEEHAHAIVIAGDLFDKLNVAQRLVKEVKAILAGFEGQVIVIPGNHDWYNASADENKLWSWFIDAPGDNVHFLKDLKSYEIALADKEIVFYPCGCHQKHCDENRIAWVRDVEKPSHKIHVGIAHGNVEGYGLDEEGNYFGMTVQELKQAEMDCWLLGHIHAPYPSHDAAGHEVFFFAGIHCADSWKSERPGGAWLIEIDDKKQIKGTRWSHSGIRFIDRTLHIDNANDLQKAITTLKSFNAQQTVLRLTLTGSLTEEEADDARGGINALTETFLHADLTWNIRLKITADAIDKLYPADSIPHTLLTTLSGTEEDRLAMQLAYETIKSLSK
jgi:DNA repair exonuclease SbcCD nuclease subunit